MKLVGMVRNFAQAVPYEASDGACALSPTGRTVKFLARFTTAGCGLLRRDPTVVESRTAVSSASELTRPQRTKTSFVVSSIRAPGLWKSRVAFASTLARRKRFETCFKAPKTRSERNLSLRENQRFVFPLIGILHLSYQIRMSQTIRKPNRTYKLH